MNAELLLAHFNRISAAPDAVVRLRKFILDLAVRGKLVEQSPNDETASTLLKRIRHEKEKAVERGDARKEKPLPRLATDDLPFSIPTNWCWSQLAEIGFLNPRNVAAESVQSSFVPMASISAEYGVANAHEVRNWGDIKSGFTHFAEGDVALAKITPCFENGKSTVLRNLSGGIGAGTTELHVIRPIHVSPDFVLIFLKSPYFIGSGIPKMTGTAGQKRVPTDYFAYSPFPLPPEAEQQRIVAKVDELMALCDGLEVAQREKERRSKHELARALSKFVLANVHRANPVASFKYNETPDGFDSVVIVAEPSPGDWWSGEVGGVTLADIRTQVEARIAAKDSLVDTYRSNLPDGAELWLLLYSGVTVARSMPIPHGIETWRVPFQFDRVFWFASLECHFTEIQKK